MKAPSSSSTISMAMTTRNAVVPLPPITSSSPPVAPEKARICENVTEATMMNRIITDTLAVSRSAFARLAQLSER